MHTAKTLNARLRVPVIGAPMFIVSGPELVIAQCTAGVVGSFPALGGSDSAENLQILCQVCNLAKSDRFAQRDF